MALSRGWSVDYLTTNKRAQQWARELGLGVVDLDVIWREIRPFKDLVGLVKLTAFLKKNNYSLIHTHTSKGGFVGRIAGRLARVPSIVHTVHGFAFHECSGSVQTRVYASLEKIVAYACDRIVTVSHYHRQWALRLRIAGPEKIVAVPNGIGQSRVESSAAALSVRRAWGCADDDVVLLSHGRLAEQKGLAYLLEALAHLRASEHRIRLFIAGEGPLEAALKAQAKTMGIGPMVTFLGYCNNIGTLLAAADVVVLPSLWEGLSISLLEAMAAGKPVITTSIGSNLEVTDGGNAALLVPPKDAGALAAAIMKLAEEKDTRYDLAERGRRIYLERYTEDRMMSGYRSIYESLLASPVRASRRRA
jgi:glycosyltransferase involved in cell wall biosynthesis